MTSPPLLSGNPLPPDPMRIRTAFTAWIMIVGAFWVVLAGRRSLFFDLDRHLVPKELALHVTALLCLVLLIPVWKRLRLTIAESLLALAALWAVASSALATNRWMSSRSVGVALSALVLYAAGRFVARSRWKPVVLGGIALAGVLAAAIGVAQAYGLELDVLATTRFPGGTFGNRNFMAHLVTIGLPILLVSALSTTKRSARLAACTGILISLTAIVLTRSRAAWLGVLAVMAVLGVVSLLSKEWRRTISREARIAALLAVVLGIAAAAFLPNVLSWNSSSPYRDSVTGLVDFRSGSGRGRLIQYRNSLDLVAEAPVFGVGPGNWFVHYPRVTTDGDPSFAGWDTIPTNPWPSSDWIAFATEVGIPGVALLLLAGLAMALASIRRLAGGSGRGATSWGEGGEQPNQREVGETRSPSVTLLATLAAVAVMGAFDAVLHLAAPAFFTAAIAGLLVPESGPTIDRELGPLTRRTFVAVSVIVVALLTTMSLGQDRSIRLTRTDRSTSAVRRALRFDPANVQLHLRLAASGPCTARLRHARIARSLLPHHKAPRDAIRACGQSS